MNSTPGLHTKPFPARPRSPMGFSLIEVLIAIFILAIGIISIASLFPVGIVQQRQTTDDIMGPVVANNALSLIRSRVKQEDFGTFEDFNLIAPLITIPGDWPWLRPGFVLEDDATSPGPLSSPTPYNDQGTVDIFSHRYVKKLLDSSNEQNLLFATQIPNGLPIGGTPILWGIPFNRSLHRLNFGTLQPAPPKFIITQQERYFPQQSQASFDASGDPIPPKSPQYTWDCMFRRFNGRVQVAIFVYRVTPPPGMDGYAYTVQPLTNLTVSSGFTEDQRQSPLPMHLPVRLADFGDAEIQSVASEGSWDADNPLSSTPRFPVIVHGNAPGLTYDPGNRMQAWQEPGQWLLDQNNNVRQVLSNGRDDPAADPLEVELLRPVSPVSFAFNNLAGVNFYLGVDPNPIFSGGFAYTDVVTDLWYIPNEVTIDANFNTATDPDEPIVSLTPVFIMVKEL